MSEDGEKRLQRTMDKLFHSPRPKPRPTPSAGGMRLPKDKKVGKPSPKTKTYQSLGVNSTKEYSLFRSLVAARSQEPVCRPWDHGDLLRRLATFKSMTWLAKPKVVSPIRCASRGWVNVDMDTISCDKCGARLLFSTPACLESASRFGWSGFICHVDSELQKLCPVEKAAAVFSLKLDGGHKLLCPWIDNACGENLALFPHTPARALVENYNERFQLLSRLSALPIILPSAIEYMRGHKLQWLLEDSPPLPRSLSGEFQSIFLSKDEALEEAASATLYYQAQNLISLCGWQPRSLPYVVDSEDWATQFAKDIDAEKSSSKIFIELKQKNVSLSEHSGQNTLVFSDFQYDPASVVLDCSLCGASVGLWAFSTVQRPLEFVRLVRSAENDHREKLSGTSTGLGSEHPNGHCLTTESSSLTLSIAGGPPPTKQNLKAKVLLPIISRSLRSRLYSSSSKGISNNNVGVGKICAIEECKDFVSSSIEEVPTQKELLYRSDNQSDSQEAGDASVVGTAGNVEISNVSEEARDSPNDGGPLSIGAVGNGKLADASPSKEPGGCQNTHDYHSSMTIDATGSHLENGEGINQIVQEKADIASCSNQLEANVDKSLQDAISAENQKLLRVDKAVQFDPIEQHRHFCPWIASTDNAHLPGWELTLSALHQESSSHALCEENRSDQLEINDHLGSVRQLVMSLDKKKRKLNNISS